MTFVWLNWAKRLHAIAQNGIYYTENPFDKERYAQIQKVASEIMAGQAEADQSRIDKLFQRERGYATPKVDVRGAVFRSDMILLVKERSDGLWTLPGGWADVGDSPSKAVEREIVEESGYETRATKLLAVLDRDHPRHAHPAMPFQVYKLFFLCEITGGAATASVETTDVDFFPEIELPDLSIGRVTPAQIARLFEHHRDPELDTDFD